MRFRDGATSVAPVEEVWKLLHDPARFPEWWDGYVAVRPGPHEGRGDYTAWAASAPGIPLPHTLQSGNGVVTVSCLATDLRSSWRLAPRSDGGTDIAVEMELPDEVAHLEPAQRAAMRASVERLARLACATAAPPG